MIVVLVAAFGVAGYFLLKPKSAPGRSSAKSGSGEAQEDAGESGTRARGRGRTTGRLKPKSKAELKAEKRRVRLEERKRRREAKRRERERRRQLRSAQTRRGSRRSARRGKKGQLYVVSAIVSLGSDSYALVDGRRVTAGDVVMGRRIVEIESDRMVVEAFGRRSTVRVGQSIVPLTYSTSKSRR
ncbi:MAG: hypothetical protein R6X12_04400 [bacterium]